MTQLKRHAIRDVPRSYDDTVLGWIASRVAGVSTGKLACARYSSAHIRTATIRVMRDDIAAEPSAKRAYWA